MPRSTEVRIDADLLARLEALPDRRPGNPGLAPTPSQVEALRRFWRPRGAAARKNQEDIAAAMGVSEGTCRKWYRQYVEAKAGRG